MTGNEGCKYQAETLLQWVASRSTLMYKKWLHQKKRLDRPWMTFVIFNPPNHCWLDILINQVLLLANWPLDNQSNTSIKIKLTELVPPLVPLVSFCQRPN